MREFKQVPFNQSVVDAARKVLARAEQGYVNFFAFVICEDGHGEDGYTGDTSCFAPAHYGLLHCAKRIMEDGDRRAAPPQNVEPPANMYQYNISVEPICHDFVPWLVTMKMMQAREGVEGPTHICITRKEDEAKLAPENELYRNEFIKSVMLPALTLFDCVHDGEARNGRTYPMYSLQEVTTYAQEGEKVPRLKAPADALMAMRAHLQCEPVVITLREHKMWDHRNSDIGEWVKFAHYLEARGEKVIFLRDYYHADEDIDGFETMPVASRNLIVRTALYESAKCNCFVSNGPSIFALFGNRPFLTFVRCSEDEEYPANRPDWWIKFQGILPPEQFPWSSPTQRMIWEPDTYENMVKAWEELFPLLQAEAA